jgi:hypothetical protein
MEQFPLTKNDVTKYHYYILKERNAIIINILVRFDLIVDLKRKTCSYYSTRTLFLLRLHSKNTVLEIRLALDHLALMINMKVQNMS